MSIYIIEPNRQIIPLNINIIIKLSFVDCSIIPVISGANPAPTKLAKFCNPPIVPTKLYGEISATNAHVGDILSPKQKIVTPITQTITKMLSINGNARIAIDATKHPAIIGVRRAKTAVYPFFYHKIRDNPT